MDHIQSLSDRAIGHDAGFDNVPVAVPMIPSGGMYSTANDMARYVLFHLRNGRVDTTQVLEQALLTDMCAIPRPERGQTLGYGLGIGISDLGGEVLLTHGGGGFGFLSDMMWLPESGMGVVVLTNSVDHQLQGSLAKELLELFLGVETEPSPPEQCEPADENDTLATCVGTYVGRSGLLTLAQGDTGSLSLVIGDEQADLQPCGARGEALAVTSSGQATLYRCELSDRGEPQRILAVQTGRSYDYNDGPNDPPGPNPPEHFSAHVGRYGVRAHGVPLGEVTVESRRGYLYLDDLRLAEVAEGLYMAANGETLDFRSAPPRWRNVPLWPNAD